MSRLSTLSSNAIRAMFSQETDEQLITLVSITNPQTPSQPVRLANGFTGRLASLTTDEEVVYGVTSRGNEYVFLPLEITLPNEDDSGIGDCNIVLNYVTQEAIELIRSHLTTSTPVSIELILSSSPDYVEAEFTGFYIISATYNAQSITLSLSAINYNREPFPCYTFTPKYFPGLF